MFKMLNNFFVCLFHGFFWNNFVEIFTDGCKSNDGLNSLCLKEAAKSVTVLLCRILSHHHGFTAIFRKGTFTQECPLLLMKQ